MDVKLIAKKVFWPIFVIMFIAIVFFVGKAVYNSIYESQVEKAFGSSPDSGVPTSESNSEKIEAVEKAFSCESNSKNVAYVYLHGFGDHNPGAFDYQRGLIGEKPILDFDYDEKLSLDKITKDFVSQFNSFDFEDVEEVIVIGQSAGGVIAANAASQLQFSGLIELHTLASPLNGYHVSEAFLGDQVGFGREMGVGFDSFGNPASNVKPYHHKTINDEELESYCGDYKNFCDGLKVQNNNLAGSEDFFYDETHASVMHPVSKLIIDCHS